MSIKLIPNNEEKQKRYVSITKANLNNNESQQKNSIIPSKTLVINELNVVIKQNFDEDIDFKITTIPGVLSDNKTIPKLNITAKEDINFDEELTLSKLESIIRRCGILDEYKDYFTNDPDIVINQYTLGIEKKYKYFNEFKEGIMIAGDIVT